MVKRNPVFILSAAVCGLGTLILAVHYIANSHGQLCEYWNGFTWTPLIGFLIFNTGISMGLGQVSNFIGGEILPANARGIGCCLTEILFSLTVAWVTGLVPYIQKSIGTGYIFVGTTCYSIALIVFVVLFVPETYGKSLEEIEQHYRNVSRSCKNRCSKDSYSKLP